MRKLLLVDDNRAFSRSTKGLLELLDFEVAVSYDVAGAREAMEKQRFSHLLLDIMLPDGSGLNVLEGFTQGDLHDVSITVITGHPAMKTAVKEMLGPSINCLIKPISFDDLKMAIGDNGESKSIQRRTQPTDPARSKASTALLGNSHIMETLRREVELVARTNANVMLIGESGVGKEVVANAIHRSSDPQGEFVATNCGAFSRELITSELFGHEKGAFTGASGRKQGVFERAHLGTLFLDEITEMPLELQPNLLRALETKTISRLGGNETIPANCRVISATNITEKELAERRKLREDLYFRLAVFPIHIPPLRERIGDVKVLAEFFLAQLNSEHGTDIEIDNDGNSRLQDYSWPGNVRELKHAIHRSFIRTESGSKILQVPRDLQSPFAKSRKSTSRIRAGRRLDDVERELILSTIERFDGDKTKSAKVLGVSVKTLYNRLKSYQAEEAS